MRGSAQADVGQWDALKRLKGLGIGTEERCDCPAFRGPDESEEKDFLRIDKSDCCSGRWTILQRASLLAGRRGDKKGS